MSQAKVRQRTLPEIDFQRVHAEAKSTARTNARLRGFIRSLHRDGRISRSERRDAINMLAEVDLFLDEAMGRADYILTNCP